MESAGVLLVSSQNSAKETSELKKPEKYWQCVQTHLTRCQIIGVDFFPSASEFETGKPWLQHTAWSGMGAHTLMHKLRLNIEDIK